MALRNVEGYGLERETCGMGFLRRRRATAPPGQRREDLRAAISGVRFIGDADPRAEDAAARDALARIVDEAVLLQGLAEDILEGIRQRRSLGELARPGGALISRFVALRAAVPEPADVHLREVARTLSETLSHHAVLLSWSLELLGDLRPERVSDQIDRIDGLGPPARRLCALQQELHGRQDRQRQADATPLPP
jgi:hypothetical protein